MADLLKQENVDIEFPRQGEIRKGTIVNINDDEILVSIGTKSEGVLVNRELERIPEEERSKFALGVEIPVYVVKPEDQNGNVVLSYLRAREEEDWTWVESLRDSGEPYEGVIAGYNKGGLLVPMKTLRGFVPASQVSIVRRNQAEGDTSEERWAQMVGEEISVVVIEVDRNRRRLILSERAAIKETREVLKDRLLDELSVGQIRTGRVTSLADFGAFVNIDGADGLVHISEISWDRINHPKEALKIGQEVEVKVISVDQDRRRIGLSMRQLQEDPWVHKAKQYRVGQLIKGTITHLTKFGAFARIDDDEDLEGLIHISELSEERIAHPKEVVKEGDEVTLRIIKIDTDRRRIGLSIRKVDSAAYADLDWKMDLADEVSDLDAEAPEAETDSPEAEADSTEAEA
ncbi:MAG: 30S ribosomal protein S1 [Anaerolineales bacterium]